MTERWMTDIRIAKDEKPKPKPANMGLSKRRQGGPGQGAPARDEIIAFIAARLQEGSSPSLEEMRVHMGWKSTSSVRDCLRKVAEKLPEGFDRSLLVSTSRKPYLARRS